MLCYLSLLRDFSGDLTEVEAAAFIREGTFVEFEADGSGESG